MVLNPTHTHTQPKTINLVSSLKPNPKINVRTQPNPTQPNLLKRLYRPQPIPTHGSQPIEPPALLPRRKGKNQIKLLQSRTAIDGAPHIERRQGCRTPTPRKPTTLVLLLTGETWEYPRPATTAPALGDVVDASAGKG
jgi:hypothetical protein